MWLGNITVAFLSAFVILIVVLYEKQLFEPANVAILRAASSVLILLSFYFAFAFLLSLARELTKDMQDIEGDRLYGCRTVPIVMGIEKTKWIVYVLLACVMGLLIYIQVIQYSGHDYISLYTLFTTLEFPLLCTFYLLYRANSSKEFSLVSALIKIVMFMGILSLLYFSFLMKK